MYVRMYCVYTHETCMNGDLIDMTCTYAFSTQECTIAMHSALHV